VISAGAGAWLTVASLTGKLGFVPLPPLLVAAGDQAAVLDPDLNCEDLVSQPSSVQ